MSGAQVAVSFTDACAADWLAAAELRERYVYAEALGWLRYDGRRFVPCSEVAVIELARQWAIREHTQAAQRLSTGQADMDEVKRYTGLLRAAKLRSVVAFARGVPGVLREVAELDADPWLLNTPGGVVDLRTGELGPHAPALLFTKLTRGSYRPGFTHPDWTAALAALDPPEAAWLQARYGQASTGLPTPDGVVPLLQGPGENGKSLLSTDGPVLALGDYGGVPSAKLLTGRRGGEHSTELADLQGQRLLVAEEMTEDHALDVTTLKRIQDVGTIRARRLYRDNFTFPASHSLFVTTNYLPVVNEVDHGTWRRLALVPFRRTFRKEHETVDEGAGERRGDPALKERIKAGDGGQHDAVVTWLVDGAVRVHKEGASALAPSPAITAATRSWRASADRVLGYWDERLVPDPTACVTAADLFADFGEWLLANGHRAWSVETFVGRFAEHHETRSNRVGQRQALVRLDAVGVPWATRGTAEAPSRVVPRPAFGMPSNRLPNRPRVWLGLRWRQPTDPERTPL